MAKGCVDMDADYCLFTVGLGSRKTAHQKLAIADADLVITLGFDMVEYHPQLVEPEQVTSDILHADFLAAEIDRVLSSEN